MGGGSGGGMGGFMTGRATANLLTRTTAILAAGLHVHQHDAGDHGDRTAATRVPFMDAPAASTPAAEQPTVPETPAKPAEPAAPLAK